MFVFLLQDGLGIVWRLQASQTSLRTFGSTARELCAGCWVPIGCLIRQNALRFAGRTHHERLQRMQHKDLLREGPRVLLSSGFHQGDLPVPASAAGATAHMRVSWEELDFSKAGGGKSARCLRVRACERAGVRKKGKG